MSVLLSEQHDAVLLLTLNRPETINAFTGELLTLLKNAFDAAAADDSVRAIVVRGSDRGFTSGQDLKAFQGQGMSVREGLGFYTRVVQSMTACEKPIIASIHGAAAGAGMSFALACDYRIAADNAVLTTGFSRIGLIPDCAMPYTLPRIVGYAKAFELATLSPRMTAQECLELGLLNKVVPLEQLPAETLAIAQHFASGPTRTYGLIKRALRLSSQSSLDEMLELEAEIQDLASQTADHKEGVQAFYEKRQPVYKGR